jgi:hypothetical protein
MRFVVSHIIPNAIGVGKQNVTVGPPHADIPCAAKRSGIRENPHASQLNSQVFRRCDSPQADIPCTATAAGVSEREHFSPTFGQVQGIEHLGPIGRFCPEFLDWKTCFLSHFMGLQPPASIAAFVGHSNDRGPATFFPLPTNNAHPITHSAACSIVPDIPALSRSKMANLFRRWPYELAIFANRVASAFGAVDQLQVEIGRAHV